MDHKLHIFNYGSAAGQLKNGVQFGSKSIIDELGKQYSLEIIEPFKEKSPRDVNVHNYDEINNDCYLLHKQILENPRDKPIFLGGDHSMAIGTVSAMLEKYDDLFVIWIDAHADINTSETTLSNNIHGMPVAQLTDLEPKYKFDWIKKHLHFDNLLYIGIRDVDCGEIEFIKQHNIKTITVDDIKINGIEKITKMIKEIIVDKPLHISLDVDGIDPKYIPSTGTSVNDGLELDDIAYLISKMGNNLKSLDIVELNPMIGTSDDIKKSIDNTVYLIEQYIKN